MQTRPGYGLGEGESGELGLHEGAHLFRPLELDVLVAPNVFRRRCDLDRRREMLRPREIGQPGQNPRVPVDQCPLLASHLRVAERIQAGAAQSTQPDQSTQQGLDAGSE